MTHSFCKEFLQGLLTHLDHDGELNVTELMRRLFEKGSKARMLSQAYHRYALNYINALNYLESLRRHNDFCDFEKVFFAKKGIVLALKGFTYGRTFDSFFFSVLFFSRKHKILKVSEIIFYYLSSPCLLSIRLSIDIVSSSSICQSFD